MSADLVELVAELTIHNEALRLSLGASWLNKTDNRTLNVHSFPQTAHFPVTVTDVCSGTGIPDSFLEFSLFNQATACAKCANDHMKKPNDEARGQLVSK